MAQKTYVLHLAHQSLQFSDPDAAREKDVRWMLREVKPPIVSYTEIRQQDTKQIVAEACREFGYRPIFYPRGDSGFAFDPDQIKLKDKGYIVGSEGIPDVQGARPDRHVCWAHMKLEDEDIWYHTAHWIAHLDEQPAQRVRRHNAMTHQMVAQVRKHAQGGALSFFSGDINIDDTGGGQAEYNQIMRQGGLLSIWDEFKVYPGTMNPRGRTIDVIGSYNRDLRVKGKRYKLHPMMTSDHRALSVWYEITRARVKDPVGGGSDGAGNPPGTGPDPAQEDFYATGGNINWSDYMDGGIYNLPNAVDDSDSQDERFGVRE